MSTDPASNLDPFSVSRSATRLGQDTLMQSLEHVVFDTAPTGHTLRLPDTAGSFHRQLVPRQPEPGQPKVVTPLMTLRDPDLTTVLIVTLPETTPVLEAQVLQEDLRQAGIEPFAW